MEPEDHGEREDDDVGEEEMDSGSEDDHDEDDESGSYDELDDLSERELEEMAASTRRSLLMVQMQMASYNGGDAPESMDVDVRTPIERWQDFLGSLADSKVLKITDTDCSEMKMEELKQVSPVLDDLVSAVQLHEKGLTRVIIEGSFLKSFRNEQRRLFEAFWSKHGTAITYLKLGSDGCPPTVLDLDSLLTVLRMPRGPEGQPDQPFNLTEIELRKFRIENTDQITSFQHVFNQTTKLKQLNLLEMQVDVGTRQLGLFDRILLAIAGLQNCDECRLSCLDASPVALISSACLAQVFAQKPKWWRMGLDGVGLDNEHCKVIAEAMTQERCKAGDLLSLTLNPAISDTGWNILFDVLFQKQRMGLVHVDDEQWQANFDLVRSMNNLHGRLGFQVSGAYPSRSTWVDWLAKLSQITWEDDAHILNYLHFSLLERPDFIYR